MKFSDGTPGHLTPTCQVSKVFPPCDTSQLAARAGAREGGQVRLLSIGQFRPEKDHPLQIKVPIPPTTLVLLPPSALPHPPSNLLLPSPPYSLHTAPPSLHATPSSLYPTPSTLLPPPSTLIFPSCRRCSSCGRS